MTSCCSFKHTFRHTFLTHTRPLNNYLHQLNALLPYSVFPFVEMDLSSYRQAILNLGAQKVHPLPELFSLEFLQMEVHSLGLSE